MIYITPEEYAIAAKNGISARNVYQRVYKYNYSNHRAITEPLIYVTQPSDEWKEWGEIALSNGISASTFRKRIYKGMEAETAAKTPLLRKGRKKGDVKEV